MPKFSIKKRLESFKYAFQGLFTLLKSEHNYWIHLTAAIVVVLTGFFIGLSSVEWIIIIICIAAVLTAEAFNTAIEALVDLTSPEHHPLAKKTKDIAAAAVLTFSIATVIIASIIFIPKF